MRCLRDVLVPVRDRLLGRVADLHCLRNWTLAQRDEFELLRIRLEFRCAQWILFLCRPSRCCGIASGERILSLEVRTALSAARVMGIL